MKRRQFFSRLTSATAGALAASQFTGIARAQSAGAASSGAGIVLDPQPQFEISPHLYMQFMEPLGVRDSIPTRP